MPLLLSGSGSTDLYSQLANVSIHSGGGACSDTPADSLGVVTWQQNTTSDMGVVSSTNTVAIQFLQGPGIGFEPAPLAIVSSAENYGPLPPPPAYCAATYPATLDAGTLTAISPGGSPVSLLPQNQNGMIGYQAPPSAGAIQPGNYSIAKVGDVAAVGQFTASATLPAPITVTTDLRPGTPIGLPFTLNWTGGGNDSVVTVQVNVLTPGQLTTPVLFATSPATAGTRTFVAPPPEAIFSIPSQADIEILVTQQPARVPSYPFSAPGLTLGGQQSWNYVFDFKGLKAQ